MDTRGKAHWSRYLLTKKVSLLERDVPPRTVMMNTGKRMFAEMLGSMFLVVYHAGLVSTAIRTDGELSYGSQAACAGAGLAAIIYGFGRISGAHVNPAITFAYWIRQDIQFMLAVAYWLAQFAGGFAAAGILAAIWGRSDPSGIGGNVPFGLNYGQAFLMEGILTVVLILVTVGAAERGVYVGAQVAIAAGAAFAAGAAMGAPYGGGSMNPARSLPVAVLQPGAIKYVWIYVGAPMSAAIVASVILHLITEQTSKTWRASGITGIDEVDLESSTSDPTLQPLLPEIKRHTGDPYLHAQYAHETRQFMSPGTTGTTTTFRDYQRGGIIADEV